MELPRELLVEPPHATHRGTTATGHISLTDEFDYRPKECSHNYRIVALHKRIEAMEGQKLLIQEIRFHFYITNLSNSEPPARQVIRNANERCNQEKLIEQTKNRRACNADAVRHAAGH